MGQSYLKNAALLTGADVLLRLAGMGLRIYLANALGGEGMGLYQLVLAVYALFVTLATAGVSVAATRLMAEELARGRAQARGMLVRLAGTGLLLGAAAMAAQYGLAGAAARWWLGDVRAAGALRVSAFGMPWMALSAVLRGFFIARRRVEPNVLSQLVEQSVRIGIIWYALEWGNVPDVSARCTAVLAATAVSEAVTNCIVHAYPDRIGPVTLCVAVYPEREVHITVTDKGVGIPDVPQAMEPLFTTGNPEERSGLGFAVMQSFMDRVKVTSRPGKGTKVVLIKRLSARAST